MYSGNGGAAGRQAADPPAIAYRKAMVAANRQHIAAMRALLSGEISHPDDIKVHADALANTGWMFAGLFPEGVDWYDVLRDGRNLDHGGEFHSAGECVQGCHSGAQGDRGGGDTGGRPP